MSESRQMRRHRERMEAKGQNVSYESVPEQREQNAESIPRKRKGKLPMAIALGVALSGQEQFSKK